MSPGEAVVIRYDTKLGIPQITVLQYSCFKTVGKIFENDS